MRPESSGPASGAIGATPLGSPEALGRKDESAIVGSSPSFGRSSDVRPSGLGDDDGMSNAPSPLGRKGGVAATSTGGLDVERLTGSIGAVVHGLDLSVPLAGHDLNLPARWAEDNKA